MNYLIIDSHNLAWQSWYAKAYSWMKNKDGEKSGHIYGALMKISSALSKIPDPVTLIFAWDLYPKATYDMFPEYKANRGEKGQEPVEDLYSLVSNLPCQIAFSEATEADDVIYTLTLKYHKKNHSVYIMSMDRDLWVLKDKATIFIEKGGKVESDSVEKRFGIKDAKNLFLWKSIFGDSSDNIPGVKRLLKRDILPLIDNSKGTPKSLFKLAKKAKQSNSIKKLLYHKDQIKLMFKVASLSKVPVRLHENKGNEKALMNYMHSWDINSLDNKMKLLFMREVNHGKKE